MKNKFFCVKKFITLSLLFLMLFVCGCKKKTYTATFKDSDGTILRVYEVPFDEAPVFEGVPEKKSDDLYDYKFYSWDKELTAVNEDTTYTAIFITSIKNDSEETVFVDDVELDKLRGDVNNSLLDDNSVSDSYFVTFLDNDNRTILQKTKFNYGTTPYFKSGSPASKIEGDYVYTFTGWDKTFSPIKGEQTYVAMYNKQKLNFSNTSQTSNNSSNQSSQNQGNYVSTNTDKELEYTVRLTAYDLSNNQVGGGTFIGGGSYKVNSRVSITAIPNNGMHFVKWNDGDTSSAKSFVVNSNVDYTAYFEKDNITTKNTFRVKVISNNSSGGIVGISPNKSDSMYEEGASVTISAAPKAGYKFGGWLDSLGVSFGSASEMSKTFTVAQDGVYTAMFIKENPVEKEDEKEEGKVTVNASISDSSAGYIEINGVSTSSSIVEKGSDVTLKVNLYDPSATSFIGWSSSNNSNDCFSNLTTVTLNSVSSDVNVKAFVDTSGSNPSGPGDDDPTTPAIETVSVSISANPSDACTLKVDDSTKFPSSYKIGQEYKFKYEQTEEQAKKYEFQYWSIGNEEYKTNPIGYNPNKSLSNVIIAVFKEKENGQKTDEEPIVDPQDPLNPDVDTSNIKIGNVVTFNGNSQKFLILDLFKDRGNTILKVLPTNSTIKTKYSTSNISKNNLSTSINDSDILKSCAVYANNLTDSNLKNHLYPINVNILDYFDSNDNYSYNVHQSSISIDSVPNSLVTLSLSCYPLGLNEFDNLYVFNDYKGIYSVEDLNIFLTLTTGSTNNSIWLKDLVSFSSQEISNGIYLSKDGIKTCSLLDELNLLPVLAIKIDNELKINEVPNVSLKQKNKYTITISTNNPNISSVHLNNNSYNNMFVENEEITFNIALKSLSGISFIKWNDGDVNLRRTITANEDTNYVAYFGYKDSSSFGKNFEIIPYIESTGEQYINTYFNPTENSKIVIQYEPVNMNNSNVGAICGVEEGNKKFDLYFLKTTDSTNLNKIQYTFHSNNLSKNTMIIDSDYEKLTIKPKRFDALNLNNTDQIYDFSEGDSFDGSNLPLFLFASNVNGTPTGLSKMKLYSCKIYENDNLVRDFIPVKNVSSNDSVVQYGLFDTIENLYYPTMTSKCFEGNKENALLFNRYTQLSYLQNNGISYVDTGTKVSDDIGIYAKIMPLSYSNSYYIGAISETDDNSFAIGSLLDTSTSSITDQMNKYACLIIKYNDTSYTSSSSSKIYKYYSTCYEPLFVSSVGYNFLSSHRLFHFDQNRKKSNDSKAPNITVSENLGNIYFGKASGDDHNISPARYYHIVISDKNNIVHNYYPVEDSENNYGFFDVVSQKFINLSSTSFKKPVDLNKDSIDLSEINILSRIIGQGDQYIDTGVKMTSSTGMSLSYIPLEFSNSYYMGSCTNSEDSNDQTSSIIFTGSLLDNRSSSLLIKNIDNNQILNSDIDYTLGRRKPNQITAEYNFKYADKFTSYYALTRQSSTKDISSDFNEIDFSKFGNILIGNVGDNHKGPCFYYSAAISNNQVITNYYVPAMYKNSIGLYDVINYKFYKSEYGDFIDGSFYDSIKCKVTTTFDDGITLNAGIYDGKINLSNKNLNTNDSIECDFLSTISYKPSLISDDGTHNIVWKDTGSVNNTRKVIAYLPKKYNIMQYDETDNTKKVVEYSPNIGQNYTMNIKELFDDGSNYSIYINLLYENELFTNYSKYINVSYFDEDGNSINNGTFRVDQKITIKATIKDLFKNKCVFSDDSESFEKEVTINSDYDLNYVDINLKFDSQLEVGDIIRFDGFKSDDNDTSKYIDLNYPLVINNDGLCPRNWKHVNNLYRVISINENNVELMDLSYIKHLMISHNDVKDLNNYHLTYGGSDTIDVNINKKSTHKDTTISIFSNNSEDELYKKINNHKYYDNSSQSTLSLKYSHNDLYGHYNTYYIVSAYLLKEYKDKTMPSFLKDAIVSRTGYLHTYKSNNGMLLYTQPDETNTIYDDVYLLGLQDILNYIGFEFTDETHIQLNINNIFNAEQKKALFDMYGFSNQFMDFSNYRYMSVHHNFLIWDYISNNASGFPKIDDPKDYTMGSDGWLSVWLENTCNNYNTNLSDINTAKIRYQNSSEDVGFCFIRPCFTIDMSKLTSGYYAILDESVYTKNINSNYIYFDPSIVS